MFLISFFNNIIYILSHAKFKYLYALCLTGILWFDIKIAILVLHFILGWYYPVWDTCSLLPSGIFIQIALLSLGVRYIKL